MTACYLVTETPNLPVSGLWKMSVCCVPWVPFLLPSKVGVGEAWAGALQQFLPTRDRPGQQLLPREWCRCLLRVSLTRCDGTFSPFTQYSAMNLVILFIMWLLLFLFKIRFFHPQPPHREMEKTWFCLCLMFSFPSTEKTLYFWDLNAVIGDPTSPLAFYPNIPQMCWFYDFLAYFL